MSSQLAYWGAISAGSTQSAGSAMSPWETSGPVVATVVAAAIGAIASVWLARRKGREEELARVRVMFAEAFQAVAQYKEFPYAIRRRRHDAPSEERRRLSEGLREIQSKLTFYEAWTRAEDPRVGDYYGALVRRTRAVAGSACSEAWASPPISSDAEMIIPKEVVDVSELAASEKAYMDAVRLYLADFLKVWRRPGTDR